MVVLRYRIFPGIVAKATNPSEYLDRPGSARGCSYRPVIRTIRSHFITSVFVIVVDLEGGSMSP